MSRKALGAAAALMFLAWAVAQVGTPAPSLAGFMPPGALVYVECRDLAALLDDWNASEEKKAWLFSDAYKVFASSRLLLRLQDAQAGFEKAAGVPADLNLLGNAAGGESAIAVYDIGELQFLYLTRMPSARAAETLLMKARGNYSPRSSGGVRYFVRMDGASGRQVAFGTSGDLLALATNETLIAQAFALLAKEPRAALSREPWFDRAVRAAGARGELRLVHHTAALVRSPHFRSYWIQRNVNQLRQFESGVADLRGGADVWTEQRVLLRTTESAPAAVPSGSLARLAAMFVPGAGLSRAWSSPSPAEVVDAIRRKLLEPASGPGPRPRTAPVVIGTGSPVGWEGGLETNIDEPPLTGAEGSFASAPLTGLFEAARPEAMLVAQSGREMPDTVFTGVDTAIVVAGAKEWDSAAARDALSAAVESVWTTSRLGLRWVERNAGTQPYHALDGISPLFVISRGNLLAIANSEPLLRELLGRAAAGAAPALEPGTVYTARFRHASERAVYLKMMSLMDYAPQQPDSQDPRQPYFFSEQIYSLSGVLGRVDTASVRIRDLGGSLRQSVEYRMRR
jgi:hypothetical protein